MAGVMDSVDQRTRLVGQNRLELLLFNLGGAQMYGINVFKVKEVLQCPKLNEIPRRHPVVRGVAHIRGATISVMDLGMAVGRSPLGDLEGSFVIITEYNRSTQGFLVNGVERIINMNWSDILPPPKGLGSANYLTAITKIEGQLVEIIDVEKILAEVSPVSEHVSQDILDISKQSVPSSRKVLILDDSTVARKQVASVVRSLGYETTLCKDGREGLDHLKSLLAEGKDPEEEFAMIISDIEMPEMDGYTFTAEVRAHPQLSKLYIMLHTSLSGVFNEAMVKKVGADDFVAKFNPDDLASRVSHRISSLSSERNS